MNYNEYQNPNQNDLSKTNQCFKNFPNSLTHFNIQSLARCQCKD